ncbi:MAG: bifunctional methylenetetrahydrofolate dehydrogenase/methenyltetrahydrofolate cyclohydrolase FolD [Clostridiales bacterium]|nr:bifunctional methylenetetrahydrofolate dehydrogenase/methenyltetrahydrofolate cyclohydrolase FolD [Clostridiales bacterium]
MQAQIIDGRELAKQTRIKLKKKVNSLYEQKSKYPGLTVVLVGDDLASAAYVRNKEKFAKRVNIISNTIRMPKETTKEELLDVIEKLNNDNDVHGILVQLPLPKHLDESTVINTISYEKDVDGFHIINSGKLLSGQDSLRPCTPTGIIKLIESIGVNIEGKNAVVVGRSNIVGKPAALLLLEKNATVTVCHSRTRDLGEVTNKADILVVAIGRAEMITGDMVKPGAVVIDVGSNYTEDKTYGDVKFDEAVNVASFITPVPGGVGPMTIAQLLENTVKAFELYG